MVFLDILEPQVLVETILDHQDIVATQEFPVLVDTLDIVVSLASVGTQVTQE